MSAPDETEANEADVLEQKTPVVEDDDRAPIDAERPVPLDEDLEPPA